MMQVENWKDLDEAGREAALARPAIGYDERMRSSVAELLAEVRRGGDAAVRSLTQRFDGTRLDDFAVGDDEIEQAAAALSDAEIKAIDTAIANVRRFHEAQRPGEISVETTKGVNCRRISQPLDAVGLYVPAGTAPLPSAAIMLAVPADIAGCPTKVLCTPPRKDGSADPAVVVAATRAGVDTIFKIGGAQAVAAMAYGTESVPRVNKICGPGNAWVTCAKSLVSADPAGAAIDMPAGPSEVLAIADESAEAAFVASDLLSQAEHGEDSQVILITTSALLAEAVREEIDKQLESLNRSGIAKRALENSTIFIVESIDEAIAVSNRYAPEHLILQFVGAADQVAKVRNAGSIFVGPWTPESVGDYCSGTNHVLPTYGYARNYSGLGLDQFLRYTTVQELTKEGLEALSETVLTLASLEGLDAHARAVSIRLGDTE
ncbi:MAG: histidinol dehydrogenase [Woeseiaceae bacterium]|nr:histidinol dehydrogenase [Woeseiaceae bacterium]